MQRSAGSLLVLSLLLAAPASAQAPSGVPSTPASGNAPGTLRPGANAPPRDRPAAPTTGTAVLRGRVLNSDGSPLRRAQISASAASAAGPRVATTDGQGKWEVTDLPAGRFNITASKAGYVTLQFGQRRPFEPGTPVVLADAQTIEKLDLSLPRGSVITGRITDEFGEPIGQATVQAMRYQYSNDGQRKLASVNSAVTDDRGEFRAYGLMPGEYYVQAGVRGLPIANGVLVG